MNSSSSSEVRSGRPGADAGGLTGDHLHRAEQARADVAGWLRAGVLHLDETVVDGSDNAPRAFVDLLAGAYTGRVVVRPSR